jgi:phage-related protein
MLKGKTMNVFTYRTQGGKDLIREYLDKLPTRESAEGYFIIKNLEKEGISFLETLNTRQLERKLWEIKYPRHNRVFYILMDNENMYLLHACKKQKGKAEKFELEKAKQRMKEIL